MVTDLRGGHIRHEISCGVTILPTFRTPAPDVTYFSSGSFSIPSFTLEFGNQKGDHYGHGNGTHPLPRLRLGRRA